LLQTKELSEALKKTSALFTSDDGQHEFKEQAGFEGALSQGIRRGTIRRSRYIGLSKTHLHEAVINIAFGRFPALALAARLILGRRFRYCGGTSRIRGMIMPGACSKAAIKVFVSLINFSWINLCSRTLLFAESCITNYSGNFLVFDH
jgi:hypothetical protein